MRVIAALLLFALYLLAVGWAAIRRARAFRAYLVAFMVAHRDELPYSDREQERFRKELEMGPFVWRFNSIARGVIFRAVAATPGDVDAPDPQFALLADRADRTFGQLLSLGLIGAVVAMAALTLLR